MRIVPRIVSVLPRLIPIAVLALLAATPALPVCTGDCNADAAVTVNEVVRGVAIVLGQAELGDCPSLDRNASGSVTIDELLQAVNAALSGCLATPTRIDTPTRTASPIPSDTPTATASQTPTLTLTPTITPTPTATVNQSPLVFAGVYRSYPELPIALPLGTDPEGGAVECSALSLPAGAEVVDETLHWTPAAEQLGPFQVPFMCSDAAVPPGSAAGTAWFKILPDDPCARPTCDPASGCVAGLPPADELCCTDAEIPRVDEPDAACPAGKVVFVGRNISGFGRLQNCDTMRVRNFSQAGAQVSFHVEARCLDTSNRIELRAHMETAHRLLVDAVSPVFLLPDPDGFLRKRNVQFDVMGPTPFFDIEGAEANLVVTLTDQAGGSVTESVRLRLTFSRVPDLPEAGMTFTPAPTPTPTPS